MRENWEVREEKKLKCYVIFMLFLCLHACYKSIFPLNTNQRTASVKNSTEVFFVQRAKGWIFAGAFYTHLKPFTMLLMTSWSKQKKQENHEHNQAWRRALAFGRSQSPAHQLAPALPWQLMTFTCWTGAYKCTTMSCCSILNVTTFANWALIGLVII